MEMNVEKTKVMRISRQPSAMQIMIEQQQPAIVGYCSYLGGTIQIMQNVRVKLNLEWPCHSSIQQNITLFTSKLDVNLGKKLLKMLHLEHSFVRC
jgi:hypothetical protein